MIDPRSFCAELVRLGDIVQDGDDTVDHEERERRFNRYIELVDSVSGDEADVVFRCLIDSIRDQEDYGAHAAALGALLRFPPERLGRLAADAMPDAIRRVPEFAGDLLGQVAFRGDEAVTTFNVRAARLSPEDASVVADFVDANEQDDGWLANAKQRGRFRSPGATLNQ